MSYFLTVLKKYAVFSGRARRKEYWMYVLWYIIIGVVLSIVDGFIGVRIGAGETAAGIGILSLIFSLATLVPTLAVEIRRLHDTNRSGWFVLLGLIPVVGSIILLVFTCMAGTVGDNKYGPDPKAGEQQ